MTPPEDGRKEIGKTERRGQNRTVAGPPQGNEQRGKDKGERKEGNTGASQQRAEQNSDRSTPPVKQERRRERGRRDGKEKERRDDGTAGAEPGGVCLVSVLSYSTMPPSFLLSSPPCLPLFLHSPGGMVGSVLFCPRPSVFPRSFLPWRSSGIEWARIQKERL